MGEVIVKFVGSMLNAKNVAIYDLKWRQIWQYIATNSPNSLLKIDSGWVQKIKKLLIINVDGEGGGGGGVVGGRGDMMGWGVQQKKTKKYVFQIRWITTGPVNEFIV